jgi:hypothetical protein
MILDDPPTDGEAQAEGPSVEQLKSWIAARQQRKVAGSRRAR